MDMNLLPKVKIEIVVSLVPVQKVIETAKRVLHTGQIGDGKAFVYDIENVVKIRTGEEGYLALQDTDAAACAIKKRTFGNQNPKVLFY